MTEGTLTTERPTLAQAVAVLAAQCDGARTRDTVGFSGVDAPFGKTLARLPEEHWDAATRRTAWVVLRKYRGQLAARGIDYTAIPEPPDVEGANRQEVTFSASKTITVDGDRYVIRFKYDPALVDKVRGLPGRRWNPQDKVWTAPLTSGASVRTFATANGFNMVGPLPPVVEEPEPAPVVPGEVKVEDNKFVIRFFGSAPGRALNIVRELAGREWFPAEKCWRVPVRGNSNTVISMARTYNLSLPPEIEARAREVEERTARLREASSALDADLVIEGLGEGLELLPYQRAGVRYITDAKRAFLADSPGLGKTPMSIAAAVFTGAFPVVCVVPKPVKLNWAREWEKWYPGVRVQILNGNKAGQLNHLFAPDVVVLNYEIIGSVNTDESGNVLSAKGNLVDLVALGAKTLIVDESQLIKTATARRTMAVDHLASTVRQAHGNDAYIYLLSGTPLVNRPGELIAQLKVLGRLAEFGGPNRFKSRYCRHDTFLTELNDRLRASCMVRRLTKDVLTELPPVRRSLVPMETTASIMAEYEKAEADVVTFLARRARELAIESGLDDEEAQRAYWEKAMKAQAAEQLVLINTLKGLAARAKLAAAVDWIKEFLSESDEKILVFADRREIVTGLADALGCPKIQGGQSGSDRDEVVQAFQSDPAERVLVCSLGAGGVGLTLTAATWVATLEQGWTPAIHQQAEGRAYARVNEAHGLHSVYLLAAGTIDEMIAALLESKRKVVDAVTDGIDPDSDAANESVLGQVLVNLANKGLGDVA